MAKAVAPPQPRSSSSVFRGPLVLSLSDGRTQLPTSYFESPYLRDLVYLDVSHVPGSLKSAVVQGSLSPANLPNLRVLKAQGREIDDSSAIALFRTFGDRLWSLDLGANIVTDGVVDYLVSYSFPSYTLRSNWHFGVEGRLDFRPEMGTGAYGRFCFVQESEWSGTFDHPQRYLIDAPVYDAHYGAAPQEDQFRRLDGQSMIKSDDVSVIKAILSGGDGSPAPDIHDMHFLETCGSHGGVSHLHLNDNDLSSKAVEKLIRASGGQLEHFECNSMSLLVPKTSLRPSMAKGSAALSGIVGAAHMFRPLFSPNLQVLRIHHSLVTNVPSLEIEDMLTMASIWLSETFIQPRVAMAYPQSFVPDMNPRLRSLTLSNIPRYSSGPIIDKLVQFLELASVQERAIQDARVASRRSPSMLRGLRHIRLEFEHDPSQDLWELPDEEEELDPEELINLAAKDFSFFGGLGWGSGPTSEKLASPSSPSSPADVVSSPERASQPHESDRLGHFPFSETRDDHVEKSGAWNGKAFTVPVWIGSGAATPQPAVNEYMSLLQDPALHGNMVPASPCHVAAGVPAGSYVFGDAWDAMLAPAEALRKPTKAELQGMRDVVAAIKEYRVKTKSAPHFHWSGKLQVALPNTMDHYHSSKQWR